MRLFDGPDEVHLRSIAKTELTATPILPPEIAAPETRSTKVGSTV
jgi:acyl-CoA dehydrogenase